VAVELVFVLGIAELEPFFGVVGLKPAGPPVDSDCAQASGVPALGILESEPVCAPTGKASITTKKGATATLRNGLREPTRHMS